MSVQNLKKIALNSFWKNKNHSKNETIKIIFIFGENYEVVDVKNGKTNTLTADYIQKHFNNI